MHHSTRRGKLPSAAKTIGGGRDGFGVARPWQPSSPEEAQRFESLRAQLPQLQELLVALRESKSRLAGSIADARKAGTRQDKAEQLEQRLALLENAKVREVEWSIPDYSQLLECCPRGQCVASPAFCAAGVAGMQLLFYPNGCKTAQEGYCSLFLRTPEGTRLSRVLYVNNTNLGPDIVKNATEGYVDACPIVPASSVMRGTAADVINVGVKDFYLQDWATDQALQKVLLIGDAPPTEMNFTLLREMRDAQRERERAESERLAAERRAAEEAERRRKEAEEEERRRAEEEAAAAAQALVDLKAAVTADDAITNAAVKVHAQLANEKVKAVKEETPEQKADREKKEKALAWLKEYQQKQKEEQAEQERQRQELEQAEREVREERERKKKEEQRKERLRAKQAKKQQEQEEEAEWVRMKVEREEEEKKKREAEEELIEVQRRAAQKMEARRREEERRKQEDLENKRLEEQIRRQEEQDRLREEQQKREREEQRRRWEEEKRKEEEEQRKKKEEQERENESRRARQEELRRLEEQRRAFEQAEQERLKRAKEEDIKKKRAEEARRQAEEVQRRREEELRIQREAEERERALEEERERERQRREEEERLERERIEQQVKLEKQRREEEARKAREEEIRRRLEEEEDLAMKGRGNDVEAIAQRAVLAGGSGMAATRQLRQERVGQDSPPSSPPPSNARAARKGPASGPPPGRARPGVPSMPPPGGDSDSGSGDDEIFDADRFRLERSNLAPSGGSNLRAWAVAANAPMPGKGRRRATAVGDSDDSADDELDWLQRQREQRAMGTSPSGVMVPSASLPSMTSGRSLPAPGVVAGRGGAGGAEESDSGSDAAICRALPCRSVLDSVRHCSFNPSSHTRLKAMVFPQLFVVWLFCVGLTATADLGFATSVPAVAAASASVAQMEKDLRLGQRRSSVPILRREADSSATMFFSQDKGDRTAYNLTRDRGASQEDVAVVSVVENMPYPAADTGKNNGLADCPCIDVDPGSRKLVDGSGVLVNADGNEQIYPQGLGSTCQAWDNNVHRLCVGSNKESFCQRRWCFVDPCKCSRVPEPSRSTYLPEVKYHGQPLYASYETCDALSMTDFNRHPSIERMCTMQPNVDKCLEAGSCAWTGKACLKKERAQLCPKRDLSGSSNCPCIKVEDFDDSDEDPAKLREESPVYAQAKASYGATCKAWDKEFNPTLCDAGQNGADSCEAEWCYVDPCNCASSIPIVARTKHLALKRGKELYLSYSTCGSQFERSDALDTVPFREDLTASCDRKDQLQRGLPLLNPPRGPKDSEKTASKIVSQSPEGLRPQSQNGDDLAIPGPQEAGAKQHAAHAKLPLQKDEAQTQTAEDGEEAAKQPLASTKVPVQRRAEEGENEEHGEAVAKQHVAKSRTPAQRTEGEGEIQEHGQQGAKQHASNTKVPLQRQGKEEEREPQGEKVVKQHSSNTKVPLQRQDKEGDGEPQGEKVVKQHASNTKVPLQRQDKDGDRELQGEKVVKQHGSNTQVPLQRQEKEGDKERQGEMAAKQHAATTKVPLQKKQDEGAGEEAATEGEDGTHAEQKDNDETARSQKQLAKPKHHAAHVAHVPVTAKMPKRSTQESEGEEVGVASNSKAAVVGAGRYQRNAGIGPRVARRGHVAPGQGPTFSTSCAAPEVEYSRWPACEEGDFVSEYSWCTPSCMPGTMPIIDVRNIPPLLACYDPYRAPAGGLWGSKLCCLGGVLHPPEFKCSKDLHAVMDTNQDGMVNKSEFKQFQLRSVGRSEEAARQQKAEEAIQKGKLEQEAEDAHPSSGRPRNEEEVETEEYNPLVFYWIAFTMVLSVSGAVYTVRLVIQMHTSFAARPKPPPFRAAPAPTAGKDAPNSEDAREASGEHAAIGHDAVQ